MSAEKISVIMPVYNAERFLREAVESVRSQTYQNWELLMLDDCSTDHSLELARALAQEDERIRVVPSEKNSGVARVRNRGIQMASGAYIAMLDSDDVWVPDKLERQLALMKQSGARIVYSSYDFIDENSHPIRKPFLVPETTSYRKMLACNVIGCSTSMVESGLIKAHPFDPEVYHEDYVLWMELLSVPGVKAAGISEPLVHYRRVSGSRSDNKRNAAKERWKIYRGSLGMGVFSSSAAFIQYAVRGVFKHYL